MTIKKYMQQYCGWKATLQNKYAELDEVEKECILPPAVRYDSDPVQHSASDDGILKIIEKLEKRKAIIINEISRILDNMQQFRDDINKVEDVSQKRLLYLYYIEGYKTLDDVAREMNYSIDWTNHLHGLALREMSNILKDDKKKQEKTTFDVL